MSHATLRPIWTPDDAVQTALDARRHTPHLGVAAPMCQCESLDCAHPYLSVAAGDRRAMFVGPVCDRCADTHMAPYLESSDQ